MWSFFDCHTLSPAFQWAYTGNCLITVSFIERVNFAESAEDCNSILGCFDMQKDLDVELCTCELACEAAEAEVCGSDGVMHTSRCEMDRLACMKDLHLEVMPDVYCHPGIYVLLTQCQCDIGTDLACIHL